MPFLLTIILAYLYYTHLLHKKACSFRKYMEVYKRSIISQEEKKHSLEGFFLGYKIMLVGYT